MSLGLLPRRVSGCLPIYNSTSWGACYSYMYLCARRDWGPEMLWRCCRPPAGFRGVVCCCASSSQHPHPSQVQARDFGIYACFPWPDPPCPAQTPASKMKRSKLFPGYHLKSLDCRFLVMLGSFTFRPSNSGVMTTWQPRRLVSCSPKARSSMSFSSSSGSGILS